MTEDGLSWSFASPLHLLAQIMIAVEQAVYLIENLIIVHILALRHLG